MYVCRSCATPSPSWVGRCGSCGEWNTLEEIAVPAGSSASRTVAPGVSLTAQPIESVSAEHGAPVPLGVDELDGVLGGGLVPGSVTLLGGEPGIGKSTLLLQAVAAAARSGRRVLYVAAEESASQVRARAERLGALEPELWLVADTDLQRVLDQFDEVRPDLVVVDSIQTVHLPEHGSAPGSVTQVRECAHRLVGEAKRRAVSVVLVGHVTKEGALAGPRVLEHLVDTVLAFEGERHHALRLLRAVKHRFGSTGEVGVFEMRGRGLVGVPDASRLLLADRRPEIAGSVVLPAVEGHRPLLVEMQALVATSHLPSPRRSGQGIDSGRLSLLLAVLDQRVGVAVGGLDVYTLAVGGVKVIEPAADLALALAIISSLASRPIPADTVVCGEIGLGGEVRSVGQLERRLAEAERMGFRRAIVPLSAPVRVGSLRCARVPHVGDAVGLLRLVDDTEPPSADLRAVR